MSATTNARWKPSTARSFRERKFRPPADFFALPSIRRAFAANLFPAACLWVFAGALVVLYGKNAAVHGALETLSAWKERLGLGFVMPAQATAGVLLPFAFGRFQKGDHRRTRGRDLPFLMLVFAVLGAATDGFYRLQAGVWGNEASAGTLAAKTACDMLIYTPFLVMPALVLAFAFKDCGYSLNRTRRDLGGDWIGKRVVPVYLSALLVWTPTVVALYSLPLALQFPFQAIVQCLWGLILVVLTDKRD